MVIKGTRYDSPPLDGNGSPLFELLVALRSRSNLSQQALASTGFPSVHVQGRNAFRHRSVLRQFRLHDYFPVVPPRSPRAHLASADRRLQTSTAAELSASASQAMPSSRSHEASEVFAVIHSGGAAACRTGAGASHASEIFRTSWRS